jgi:hypothetical protein
MIEYTISDLNEAEELFGDLSQSADNKALLHMCMNSLNYSNSFQPMKIEVARKTQSKKMVFCTPEEAFDNPLNWKRNLEACSDFFKKEFTLAVESLQDTSSSVDIVKHFEHLKQKKGTEQRFIVIGDDLTKPSQILDLCGVLLFYDINYEI